MRILAVIIATLFLSSFSKTSPAQTADNDSSRSRVSRSAFPTDSPPQKHKPNPTGALLRSAIVPGWGQWYNKKYFKSAIFASGEGYLIYGIASDWHRANKFENGFKNATDPAIKADQFNAFEKYRDRRNVKMWILTAAIFYSMFDAYVDAQLTDFDEKDKAYDVFLTPVNDGGLMLAMNFRF